MIRLLSLLLLLHSNPAVIAQSTLPIQQQAVVFAHVTVIDAVRGTVQPDMSVIIAGDRIADVRKASDLTASSGAKVIDCHGKFVIAGLWDMHVHTFNHNPRTSNEWFFPLFLANGVTGIRDMWTTPEDMHEVLKWRKGLANGSFLGPRFGAAGNLVDGPEPVWANSDTLGTPEQAQDFVHRFNATKLDFIKVYTNLPPATYLALAGEARKLEIPFAGHVPIGISASEASEAGQRSIEHLDGVLAGCSTKEAELLQVKKWGPQWQKVMIDTYEQARCEKLFSQFARNQTWQVPTLTVFGDRGSQSDPRMKYVPASARTARQKLLASSSNRSAEQQDFRKRVWEKRLSVTAGLSRAGVPIMAGTDVASIRLFPGFSLHDELSLLVQAGLSAREALQAATYSPAKFLGILDRFGSVEKGKIADIVLLDANPLEDIRNTQRIHAVVMNGRYLDRAALNDLLARATAMARAY